MKTFDSVDGEHVTIGWFDSLEAIAAWREHPIHQTAQFLGRSRFYESYDLSVARIETRRRWRSAEDGEPER
jgi:heme-degrading monooxygenase HmoA